MPSRIAYQAQIAQAGERLQVMTDAHPHAGIEWRGKLPYGRRGPCQAPDGRNKPQKMEVVLWERWHTITLNDQGANLRGRVNNVKR